MDEELSKYQKKQIKRMTKTLHGKIAFEICMLEQDFEVMRLYGEEWANYKHKIEGTDVTLMGSKDSMVWHIYRPVEYKANRYYLKIVPKWDLSYDLIVDILEASPWLYV